MFSSPSIIENRIKKKAGARNEIEFEIGASKVWAIKKWPFFDL